VLQIVGCCFFLVWADFQILTIKTCLSISSRRDNSTSSSGTIFYSSKQKNRYISHTSPIRGSVHNLYWIVSMHAKQKAVRSNKLKGGTLLNYSYYTSGLKTRRYPLSESWHIQYFESRVRCWRCRYKLLEYNTASRLLYTMFYLTKT